MQPVKTWVFFFSKRTSLKQLSRSSNQYSTFSNHFLRIWIVFPFSLLIKSDPVVLIFIIKLFGCGTINFINVAGLCWKTLKEPILNILIPLGSAYCVSLCAQNYARYGGKHICLQQIEKTAVYVLKPNYGLFICIFKIFSRSKGYGPFQN